MSIFPDDDKRRKQGDLADDDARQKQYDEEPVPNPPHAFSGGTIRDGRRTVPSGQDSNKRPQNDNSSGAVRDGKKQNVKLKQDLKLNTRGDKAGAIVVGLLITLGILAGCGAVFFFVIGPMTGLFNPFGENTREVPGDAAMFDPIASYAEIAAYAQGESAEISFVEMSANFVKRDGTLDLYADYFPRVEWEFVVPVPRPEDAPPVGAGGSPDDRYFQAVTVTAFQPGQIRSVTQISGGSRTSYTYKHLGLQRDTDEPRNTRADSTNPPVCSFKSLWDVAVERGAPPDAVAVISYDENGYDFRIRDTDIDLSFTQNCRVRN